jgi:hypothetical protein
MIISTPEKYIQPIIQYIGTNEKRLYRIVEDYCFEWSEKSKLYRRVVYADYPNDLASVPDLPVIDDALDVIPYGASDGGAVGHDREYEVQGVFPPGEFLILEDGIWKDCKEKWSRFRSDWMYAWKCTLGGMSHWKAWYVEFPALRAGGGIKDGRKWYFS